MFAGIFGQIVQNCEQNPHITSLLREFNDSLAALSRSQTSAELKSFIQRACNQAEGLARSIPGIHGTTLGDICSELKIWPHSAVKSALSNLYGFCSDYPGIRHAGNPKGQHRELELRDSVLISLLLLAFSAYFMDSLDFDEIIGARESGRR